ncbi:hypothetical protein QZM22_30440 [Burkholderia oklahomensis]|uniref:hypothetical protein n=1 Tax=Burkholderia oklahomensis TaxID=342113 RepID=UPI00264EB4AA|nr:hypothetical protein [Burkholderia oklahomensis]MDN7676681.1 hypothetical protein [Burkholderia oklahomensis]
MFAQFSDSDEKVIVAIFASEQDQEAFPNQAEIDESDPRYKAYFDALPVFAQEMLEPPSSSLSTASP